MNGFEFVACLAFAPPLPVARIPRGEVLVDAREEGPPRAHRTVHGTASAGLQFGFVLEDPIAAFSPRLVLDFREAVALRVELAADLRLRWADRWPDQSGVIRRAEWDEVGDYLAIVRQLNYDASFAAGRRGFFDFWGRLGALRGVTLGHGSMLWNFDNGLDVDRPRAGVVIRTRLAGSPVRAIAGFDTELVVTDIAGSQVLGTRVAGDWAGAGVGLSAAGDPTAPRRLRDDDDVGDQGRPPGRLRADGPRGVAGLGVDTSYRIGHGHQQLTAYVDGNWFPRLGRGIHIGVDGSSSLNGARDLVGRATIELTVGSSGYDPAYFDIFYLSQKWQAPPKAAFVRAENLAGVGARAVLEIHHAAGVSWQLAYRYRPGPLGHTASARVGCDLRVVTLSLLLAQRAGHGFAFRNSGTVARGRLRVPVARWVDFEASGGWMFAVRTLENEIPDRVGTVAMTAGGVLMVGAAGRFAW